ncbi:MAG: AbrB family transcriptional regulator [Rhodobacteraceae bacterium]|nr:AbrB family transcriptional regulator [Paracoccaceae bacterium]
MIRIPDPSALTTTLKTLAVGGAGAALGYVLNFPLWVLTGPAIAVALLGLTGQRFTIPNQLRDPVFVLLGIAIGSGFTPEATASLLRWPLAFGALAITVVIILATSRHLLAGHFNFDAKSAVIAASPGHLTFVLSYAAEHNLNLVNVSLVQSIRLLVLTICVPLVASAFGYDTRPDFTGPSQIIPPLQTALLFVIATLLGLVFKRLNIPAALLIAGMVVSAVTQGTGLTPGRLSPFIILPGFVLLGALIGTRFSGVTLAQLRGALAAGLSTTAIAIGAATLAAWPVALWLGVPIPHIIVAFAPGGLETMVAMGAILGANPGLVAACHMGRLLFLTFLIPLFLRRYGG